MVWQYSEILQWLVRLLRERRGHRLLCTYKCNKSLCSKLTRKRQCHHDRLVQIPSSLPPSSNSIKEAISSVTFQAQTPTVSTWSKSIYWTKKTHHQKTSFVAASQGLSIFCGLHPRINLKSIITKGWAGTLLGKAGNVAVRSGVYALNLDGVGPTSLCSVRNMDVDEQVARVVVRRRLIRS